MSFSKQIVKNLEKSSSNSSSSSSPSPKKHGSSHSESNNKSTEKKSTSEPTSNKESTRSLRSTKLETSNKMEKSANESNKSMEVDPSSQSKKEAAKKETPKPAEKFLNTSNSKKSVETKPSPRQEKVSQSKSDKPEKMEVSVVLTQKADKTEMMDVSLLPSQNAVLKESNGKPIIVSNVKFVEPIYPESNMDEDEEEEEEFELAEIVDDTETGTDGNAKEIIIRTEYNPSDANPYKCLECDKSFKLKQLLDIHIDVHQRDRAWPCPQCDKAFYRKGDLAKHAVIHTGEKNFACIMCDKSFSRYALLARHERLIHKDCEKYQCEECKKEFLSSDYYAEHMKSHDRQKYTCKICNKKFAYKQGLERHEVAQHSNEGSNSLFSCEVCGENFGTMGKLEIHLKQHQKNIKAPIPEEDSELIGEFIVENNVLMPLAKKPETGKRKLNVESQETVEPKRLKAEEKTSTNAVQSALNKLPKGLMVKKMENQEKPAVIQSVETTKVANEKVTKPVAKLPTKQPTVLNYMKKTSPDKVVNKVIKAEPISPAKQPEPKILNQAVTKPNPLPKIVTKEVEKKAETSKNDTNSSQTFQPGSQSTPKPKPARVERIKMTKAQISALIAEGKIEMKNGNMVMKK